MKKIINDKERLSEMGSRSLEIIKEWSFDKICNQIEKIVSEDLSKEYI
jgi:hypothetical protein